METNEIEDKVACGEMTAAQVFTQMMQHIGCESSRSNKLEANKIDLPRCPHCGAEVDLKLEEEHYTRRHGPKVQYGNYM